MIKIKTERQMKRILTLKALIVGKVLRVKTTGQGVPAGAVAEDKRIRGKEKEALGGGPRTVQGRPQRWSIFQSNGMVNVFFSGHH